MHHLVTTVRGQLRPGLGLPEILRACLPRRLDHRGAQAPGHGDHRRARAGLPGPYTGATGWLGAAGDFDLAIAIRTALLEGDELTLWVGGGIVVDSSPEAELEETAVKAARFRPAGESD